MSTTFHVEESAVINAPPARVYAVMADYRVGHPAVLPKPAFTRLVVEEGGVGAGTRFRVYVNVLGKEYVYHQVVTEPEPGRILRESDLDSIQYTTITVDPLAGGTQSRVTIATEFQDKPGVAGFLNRLMQLPVARRLYRQELQNLAEYVVRNT